MGLQKTPSPWNFQKINKIANFGTTLGESLLEKMLTKKYPPRIICDAHSEIVENKNKVLQKKSDLQSLFYIYSAYLCLKNTYKLSIIDSSFD